MKLKPSDFYIMKVVLDGQEQHIFRRKDGVFLATVYERDGQDRLARQFAASAEMLLVCELLPGAENDAQLLHELIKKAREITARIKGEQDETAT